MCLRQGYTPSNIRANMFLVYFCNTYFREWLTMASFLEVAALGTVPDNRNLLSATILYDLCRDFCTFHFWGSEENLGAIVNKQHLFNAKFAAFFRSVFDFLKRKSRAFGDDVLLSSRSYNCDF